MEGMLLDPWAVATKVLWNRVYPSLRPSFRLCGCFFGIVSLFFSKFCYGARNPNEVVRDNWILGKWTKNEPKTKFFKFIEKLCHWILLDLFYNENLYILLCCCTNPIFGKIFVPEIWAKMFSANQIAGFFNQPLIK